MDRVLVWHRAIARRDDASGRELGLEWSKYVEVQLRDAGGLVLAAMGSSVCAVFEARDAGRAIDAALALVTEAKDPSMGVRAAFGVGAGHLDDPRARVVVGSAIDRAQLLANRAHASEVVLDDAASALVRATHLFSREVRTGVAGARGKVIDPRHPRRDLCRVAARSLRAPPLRSATQQAVERILELAATERTHVVLASAEPDDLEALFEALRTRGALVIPAVPLALEPLGSLRLALTRHHGGVAPATKALRASHTLAALSNVVSNMPAARGVTRDALCAWLTAHRAPVLLIESVESVDLGTLDVCLSAASRSHIVVVTRRPASSQGTVPTALSRLGEVHDLTLEAASNDEVRAMTTTMFDGRANTDVIDHTLELGGKTAVGCHEAALTLVSSGDVVEGNGAFGFRRGPREHREPGVASLILERAVRASKHAYRLLEVVCVLPDGSDEGIVTRVAERCGIDAAECEGAMKELVQDGLLRDGLPPRAASAHVRSSLEAALSPSRALALHHFAASELAAALPPGSLVQGTVAYYLAHAAKSADAARAALAAGGSALSLGFKHAAVRLAAYSVQLDPSDETRSAAALLTSAPGKTGDKNRSGENTATRGDDTNGGSNTNGGGQKRSSDRPKEERSSVFPSRGSGFPGAPDDDVLRRTVEALREGDAGALDRHIDLASAMGRDAGAVNRLRAMAHLVRGDVPGAMQALAAARAHDSPDRRSSARASLALSLVLLRSGNTRDAIRAALTALGHARSLRDMRGEAAAMRALSGCYRAAGKAELAQRIDDAAPDLTPSRDGVPP